ncbi:GLUG motif-containing protein [Methanimicrococcus stummii]|uniref:GLUG motif-containing protein n=1 Tax=Methanimicrococcus stummii TaxID=3028294 RepID=UPI00292CE0D9|nr:GLUG motif-containing protein [Methanimicrococcus sp. Es2]
MGSFEDPYQITTIEQLDEIRNHLNSNFVLMNDLDFSESDVDNWLPIGKEKIINDLYCNFEGSLNGNNKTISNLVIDFPDEVYNGFFYAVWDGSVSNLNFENASVPSKSSNVGILAALIGPNATVENVGIFNSTVTGEMYVGILSGISVANSTISNCTIQNSTIESESAGAVSSTNRADIMNVHVSNCTIKAVYCGGLVAYDYGSISNCSVTNSYIETKLVAGGIAGSSFVSTIQNCYTNNVSIVAIEDRYEYYHANLGGIIGNSEDSIIENCFSTASIVSYQRLSYNGGIAGNCTRSDFKNCIAVNEKLNHHPGSWTILNQLNTGKIAGHVNDSDFENCYYWHKIKSNKIIFDGENGKRVTSAKINDFPNGIWNEWEADIWAENPNENESLPILKNQLFEFQND